MSGTTFRLEFLFIYFFYKVPVSLDILGFVRDSDAKSPWFCCHLQELMQYCALDVEATHQVFSEQLPLFMERSVQFSHVYSSCLIMFWF